MKPPTEPQRKVLRLLADGGRAWSSTVTGSFPGEGGRLVASGAAMALERSGLIRLVDSERTHAPQYEITDAGAAWLAEQEPSP